MGVQTLAAVGRVREAVLAAVLCSPVLVLVAVLGGPVLGLAAVADLAPPGLSPQVGGGTPGSHHAARLAPTGLLLTVQELDPNIKFVESS